MTRRREPPAPPSPYCQDRLHLKVHVNASLNVGLSTVEIVEAITHAAVYCGFPKALNAIFVAKRVFAERDLLPVRAPQA